MSTEEETRKRQLSSPDTIQDKDKITRTHDQLPDTPKSSKSGNDHPSIILAAAMRLGVSSPPKEVDCGYLYKVIVKLEHRLAQTETKLEEKDDEILRLKNRVSENEESITGLGERLHTLENAPAVAPATAAMAAPPTTADAAFLQDAKRELPLLSDGCAKAEDNIRKIQTNLESYITRMEQYQRDLVVDIQTENRRRYMEAERQEQYSRKDCVLLKGVPYVRGENTTDIACQIAQRIGVTISASDISVSHRTGKQYGNQPKPIIIKFTRRETKFKLLNNRRETRHITTDPQGRPVKIFLDENLTSTRARVCKKLREDKIMHHVEDGKIFITPRNANWIVLDTPNDWEALEWSDRTKVDLGIYPRD